MSRENDKSLQQNFYLYPFLSRSLSLSGILSVSLPLILLPQQLPPAALITTSTKYPVENTSSLIRDCSILSVQRHYFLSRRLGYQTRARLQGDLLIHWHSLVSPTLDLSELKGGASHSMTKLCGKTAAVAEMSKPCSLFSDSKGKKDNHASVSRIMALKCGCWSVCTTATFKVRAIRGWRWIQQFVVRCCTHFVQINPWFLGNIWLIQKIKIYV